MAIEELEGIGKMYQFDDTRKGIPFTYSVFFARSKDRQAGFPTGYHLTPLQARTKAELLKGEGGIEAEWPQSELDEYNKKMLQRAVKDRSAAREFNEAGLTPPTAPILIPKPATATVVVNAPAKNPLDDLLAWFKSIVGR